MRSFGKCHLDDVASELNTMESVAHWCRLDLRTGRLSVTLEDNRCFDAEVYADEIDVSNRSRFREDQRINLGKWVLRWLFAPLVEEEVNRDNAYRASAVAGNPGDTSAALDTPTPTAASKGLTIPIPHHNHYGTTLRPSDTHNSFTPGFGIGFATPGVESSYNTNAAGTPASFASAVEDTKSEMSSLHQKTPYSEKGGGDYFTSKPVHTDGEKGSSTPGGGAGGGVDIPTTPTTEPDKEEKKKSGSFLGVKFPMGFPRKLSRTYPEAANKQPVQQEEKAVEESDKSSAKEERVFEQNLGGFMERTKYEYDEFLAANPGRDLVSSLIPSNEIETPHLTIPSRTTLYIQEESVDSAVAHDLYGGSMDDLKGEVDKLEKAVPLWLAELLFKVSCSFPSLGGLLWNA